MKLLHLVVFGLHVSSSTGTDTSTGAPDLEEDTIIIIDDSEDEAVGTSSASDIIIIDDGSLAPEDSGPSSWDVRARATVELDARVLVDTSFDRAEEQVGELHLGGRLELDVELGAGVSLFAAPNFTYVSALDREADDRHILYLLPPEAYVSWSAKWFRLRAGLLTFSWGSSDFVAPSDVLNPVDLRRSLLAVTGSSKIPMIAAELTGHFGPLTVRGVVAPFFTASRFHLVGWDFAVLNSGVLQGQSLPFDQLATAAAVDEIGDQLLVNERPNARPDNATLGARATLAFGDIDVSATAVYGWDTLPQINADPDLLIVAQAYGEILSQGGEVPLFLDGEAGVAQGRLIEKLRDGETLFEGQYKRRSTIGFDMVYAWDPVIFKVDVAYTFGRTFYTQDNFRAVRHPWLNAVIGMEYLYGDELQVIVEAFTLAVIDIASNYRLALFEQDTPPPSQTGSGKRTVALPGAIAAVRYSILDGDLRFELGLMVAPTRGDVVILPSIAWRISDTQQLTLGGAAIEGKKDSYGGAYTHTDQLYLAYRWTY